MVGLRRKCRGSPMWSVPLLRRLWRRRMSALGVSLRTVQRDWLKARAWLFANWAASLEWRVAASCGLVYKTRSFEIRKLIFNGENAL